MRYLVRLTGTPQDQHLGAPGMECLVEATDIVLAQTEGYEIMQDRVPLPHVSLEARSSFCADDADWRGEYPVTIEDVERSVRIQTVIVSGAQWEVKIDRANQGAPGLVSTWILGLPHDGRREVRGTLERAIEVVRDQLGPLLAQEAAAREAMNAADFALVEWTPDERTETQ